MKLATFRADGSTVAVRVDADAAVEITGYRDVGDLLQNSDWLSLAADASGTSHTLSDVDPSDWAPVVPNPTKVVCVGLNYANHIREMGRELPEFPTLFAKYPEALIGPFDDIVQPGYASQALDWEGELAVIVGTTARRVEEEDAAQYIAGYSILNDLTMRDYQYRTPEWFQGKTFENSAPFGPFLVTSDAFEFGGELKTEVDGEAVQVTTTDDLVFSPAQLISYISKIVTLNPGDVIATGTPGGVGHARKPPRYLADGNILTTSIGGIGTISSRVVIED